MTDVFQNAFGRFWGLFFFGMGITSSNIYSQVFLIAFASLILSVYWSD